MDQENDQFLTKLSVRLVNLASGQTAGSGIIYSHPTLQNKLYVLTAAHCLYEDGDNFEQPLDEIGLDFFNSFKSRYECIKHRINYDLVSADIDNDVAILLLKVDEVEVITGEIPIVNIVTNRNDHTRFLSKGFPSATNGKEIVAISPEWVQRLSDKNLFQLHLNQDFSDAYSSLYRVDGFSGSGIFLYSGDQIYLYGIFTRFLDAGKIIYCHPMTSFSHLLSTNYLPSFSYTFFASQGFSSDFFHKNAKRTITELGPRFSSELNFQLPIARYFNAITKDDHFKQELTRIVDKQLSEKVYSSVGEEVEEIDGQYEIINGEIKKWYNSISWRNNDPLDITAIIDQINNFEELTLKKREQLYEKRRQIESLNKNNNRIEPYQNELSHLHNLLHNFLNFKDEIQDSHISLSNSPVLLIKGNAGSGKSHLLGDILLKRNQVSLPTILLLGQLFVKGKTIWENVLNQLGLKCSQQEFLIKINSIGEQIGARVLIMVDAINEGAGKELWQNGLASFIHDFGDYPAIALVISIRTTYWKVIVPENVNNNINITKIDHEGFRGNEYEAVKLFCEFYELKQPNFPLLNPEYSNPLFLHLICKGIQGSKEKVFPQGFQGITKVFRFYLKSVLERLILKREIYDYAPNLLINSLNSFAKACFEYEKRSLKLSDALALFNKEFSDYPNLLADLIEESVLIRSLPLRYGLEDEDEEEEIVYFAYERFGDFYLAAELIKNIKDRKDLLFNFRKNEPFGKLIEQGGWSNSGILEALAVLLPEKFGLEIFEVYDWVFTLNKNDQIYTGHSIHYWFLNSLKWRNPATIDDEKITDWVKTSKQFKISKHEFYNFLFEMCAVNDHPFNSNRLTQILSRYSMAERDAQLQQYFLYYSGIDDSGTALPIQRLIDWAWRPSISLETSFTSAKLVGQALVWILSSTSTGLRDKTTKALVNLLQDQVPALIELFKKFIGINDPYIAERICAVAYGCALRSKDNNQLRTLAQTVYDEVFRSGKPPTHLFLRDYCRHIVELALSRGVVLDLTGANFRPPYNTILPSVYPTREELDIYTGDENERGKKGVAARANKRIIFSVISWDFGRYTIESAVRHFEPVPFRFEEEEKLFRKAIPRGGKSWFDLLKKFYELYVSPSEIRMRNVFATDERRIKYWKGVDEFWLRLEENLLSKLGEDQKVFYREKIIPYWALVLKTKKTKDPKLEHEKIKIWIAKRAFDLGYDGNLHGNFDDYHDTYDRSDEAKIERIGKKYQWIAFYEVLGILADNYKVRELYGVNKKSWIYNGPWDITYRDIDPSFTSIRDQEKYVDDDFGLLQEDIKWYFPQKYLHWNNLQDNWADTVVDLPSFTENIQRSDTQGKEWLYLYSSYKWIAPKLIGESSIRGGRKEIWYMFQTFIVPKSRYNKTVKWLCNQEFNGRWLPEPYEVSNLFARECYWSPLSKMYQKEHGFRRKLEDSNLTITLPVVEAIGSLDKDRSGAHFWYKIPNREIFESLGLTYSSKDGDFEDENGEILFMNVSSIGCLIRKDVLQKYLDDNNLQIIWTLLGEKNSFYDRGITGDIRKSISGVVVFENNDLINKSLKVIDW